MCHHTYIIIVYYKKEHCLTKDKYSEHIAQASIVMLIKSVVSPHKDATTWIFLELCQAQLIIYWIFMMATYLKNCEQMMLMKAATFYKQEILDTYVFWAWFCLEICILE